jgi:hypothetical protein
MRGIKIFRLQEWKVRATARTRSPNLAAAAAFFPTATDNTLYNQTRSARLTEWNEINRHSQTQHPQNLTLTNFSARDLSFSWHFS